MDPRTPNEQLQPDGGPPPDPRSPRSETGAGGRPAQGAARADSPGAVDTNWHANAGATDFLGLDVDLTHNAAPRPESPASGAAAFEVDSWLLSMESDPPGPSPAAGAAPASMTPAAATTTLPTAAPRGPIATPRALEAEVALDDDFAAPEDEPPARRRRRGAPLVLAGFALLAAVCGGAWWWNRTGGFESEQIAQNPAPVTKPATRETKSPDPKSATQPPRPTPSAEVPVPVSRPLVAVVDETVSTPDLGRVPVLHGADPSTPSGLPIVVDRMPIEVTPTSSTEGLGGIATIETDAARPILPDATSPTSVVGVTTTVRSSTRLPRLPALVSKKAAAAAAAREAEPARIDARRASAEDLSALWMSPDIPYEAIDGEKRLRTLSVGVVRAVLRGDDVVEGQLYSVGRGQISIDTNVGRLTLAHRDVSKLIAAGSEGATAPSLPLVEVISRSGSLFGRLMARDGDRVVVLTDGGVRIAVDALEVRGRSAGSSRVLGIVDPDL